MDVSDPDWNLQVSLLNWNVGDSVDRHVHLNKSRVSFSSTARSMGRVEGAFEVNYYDVDCEEVLHHCVAKSGSYRCLLQGCTVSKPSTKILFLGNKIWSICGQGYPEVRGL